MDRASIRATEAICSSLGLEPSRLGKFRVVCRMAMDPLEGTSPAPKQGPQKEGFKMTPAEMRVPATPVFSSSISTGPLAG